MVNVLRSLFLDSNKQPSVNSEGISLVLTHRGRRVFAGPLEGSSTPMSSSGRSSSPSASSPSPWEGDEAVAAPAADEADEGDEEEESDRGEAAPATAGAASAAAPTRMEPAPAGDESSGVLDEADDEDERAIRVPLRILPHPIRRQCLSTRLDNASFSFSEVQTGEVRAIFARSALMASTRPPVDIDPMFTMRISPFANFLI